MKSAIQGKISELMDNLMDRVLNIDPFIPEKHRSNKPLYAALVPDEIFKGSHFERRFVTPFGGIWEKLAVIAANHGIGKGVRGKKIDGVVKEERLHRISEILNRLEHKKRSDTNIYPDWEDELSYILDGKGEPIPTTVICDLFVEDLTSDKHYAFELKAPLPNSDQTKVSKEKILKLLSMDPCHVHNAYYALPYNPYGTKENYQWSFPARWFNMQEDPVVLIGDEFWEKIGGSGTYETFIDAVNEIGREYRDRIYREYLGIEPPEEIGRYQL